MWRAALGLLSFFMEYFYQNIDFFPMLLKDGGKYDMIEKTKKTKGRFIL